MNPLLRFSGKETIVEMKYRPNYMKSKFVSHTIYYEHKKSIYFQLIGLIIALYDAHCLSAPVEVIFVLTILYKISNHPFFPPLAPTLEHRADFSVS
jgi:hypothetical protein